MQLNEKKIRLSGLACLPSELILDKTYDLEIKAAEVREVKDIPNDNGSFDRVYKLTITPFSEVIIKSEKEVIKAKKKGSQSQLLRNLIYRIWENQYSGQYSFDDYYKLRMSKIIRDEERRLL